LDYLFEAVEYGYSNMLLLMYKNKYMGIHLYGDSKDVEISFIIFDHEDILDLFLNVVP